MLVTVEYSRKSVRKLFHTDTEAAAYIDTMRKNPAVTRITSPGRPTTDTTILGIIVWYEKEIEHE